MSPMELEAAPASETAAAHHSLCVSFALYLMAGGKPKPERATRIFFTVAYWGVSGCVSSTDTLGGMPTTQRECTIDPSTTHALPIRRLRGELGHFTNWPRLGNRAPKQYPGGITLTATERKRGYRSWALWRYPAASRSTQIGTPSRVCPEA